MTSKSSKNPLLLLLIVALSWPIWAGACALCQSYDGVIFSEITLEADRDKIHYLDIRWPFSEGLTEEITLNFDANRDGTLDENEVAELLDVWEDELKNNRFYTLLWINGQEVDTPIGINRQFSYHNNSSEYRFRLNLNLPITDGDKLEIRFFEQTGALSFFFDRQSFRQDQAGPWQIANNLNTFPHTLALNFTPAHSVTGKKPLDSTLLEKSDQHMTPPKQTDQGGNSGWLGQQLAYAFGLLRGYLHELKDNPSGGAFWGLMAFSFLYGLLHAAGPGHGKTLVMTYFFSAGGGWKKAGVMAFLIGVIHVFSALILTAILLFVLTVVFSAALEESTLLLTRLSGVLIVLIAAHLFWRNLRRRYRTQPKPNTTPAGRNKISKFTATAPTHTHDHTCGCASCGEAGRSSDLGLVLAAGIIPCPGTVTIFLFALSLGLYLTGLGAAVAMSAGMGLIIFLAAGFGSAARRLAGDKLGQSLRIFELIGAGVIMALGFWLLLA